MYTILYLKEILRGGTISRRQRTGYKLRFSADISLTMLMAVIHGLFVVSAVHKTNSRGKKPSILRDIECYIVH